MSIQYIPSALNGQNCAIGIVQARFNLPVCEGLLNACLNELALLGVQSENITVATVPGALEIPLVLQKMAATLEFDALIAIGAVIRGETYHFEVVSNESARAVGQVALECDIPIANAILTTNTDEQALARVEEKGRDAARVAVEMANLSERILPDDEFFE